MRASTYKKQAKVLECFVEVFCRKNHGSDGRGLCPACTQLLEYAHARLRKCPYDPKPKCKDCPTHCYKPEYREKIREVMRFSGMYFVKRGRIDWMVRYLLSEDRPARAGRRSRRGQTSRGE